MNRRDVVAALAAAPVALDAALAAVPGGAQPDYGNVDPEMVAALTAFPTLAMTAERLRAGRARPAPVPLPAPMPAVVERHIPGAAGAPPVRVLLVDPQPGARRRPVYLHMHGGGYILGAPDPAMLQRIAQRHGCVVVSVDYRLAPETRFRGSLDDNYAALAWLNREAAALGIDPHRIAVGGDSAGGGHAALLAIAARDRREYAIAFQLLIYPMLDDRTGTAGHPVPPGIGHFIWPPATNSFGWSAFLGVPAGSAAVPAAAVPARIGSVAGLPPAFIGVGAIDLFVDEDLLFARRLIDAGVATELVVVPGAYHGFDVLAPKAAASRRFVEAWNVALARGLGVAG